MPVKHTISSTWTKRFYNFSGICLGQFDLYTPRPIVLSSSYSQSCVDQGGLRFSVVTPVYNQRLYIGDTIRSVINQRYKNLEYIVIDGGSTDGTCEIIERDRDKLFAFESKPDRGQAHAINKGFSYATGEIMAWINGDDLLLPGTMMYVSKFFDNHPNTDVIYGHRIIIDAEGNDIGRWVLPKHDDQVLSLVDFIPQETLFWRRSAWEQVGGRVDESFDFAMDWDLLVRFRDAKLRIERLPRYLGAFRFHSAQKTSLAIASVGLTEMNRIRRRCLGEIPSTTKQLIAIAPYLIRHIILQKIDQYCHIY